MQNFKLGKLVVGVFVSASVCFGLVYFGIRNYEEIE